MNTWGDPQTSVGNTESERYLVRLAKKAFLSLWSYPNVYTDEGRRGKGSGKELCDLLVIFGNDIIIFSDKDCKFTPHEDINVAWHRWYKRAIEKSAKQLSGAESWINRFPDRLFLDSDCQFPMPIKLPTTVDRRIHLVAVTRGSSAHAQTHWGGGSSGSLFIDTTLVGDNHKNHPFCVGWVLPNKRLVHVLDETTLDIILNELDTISDFVTYLTKKEEQLTTHGVDFVIPGEEELIAWYLSHFDHERQEHYFPNIPEGALLALREGDWESLVDSPAYKTRREANEISYLWDYLIEFQNQHIISGSASSLIGDDTPNTFERVMRMMASENRLSRRALGESFHIANSITEKDKRFTRTIVSTSQKGRGYIFMSLSRPDGFNAEEYLEMRRGELTLFAHGCKLKFEGLTEIVGLVFEPGQNVITSIDYFLINFGKDTIDEDFKNELKQKLNDANMWKTENVKTHIARHLPFPRKESLIYMIALWLKYRYFKIRRLIQQLLN